MPDDDNDDGLEPLELETIIGGGGDDDSVVGIETETEIRSGGPPPETKS